MAETTIENYFDRGVLSAGHPPVVDHLTLAATSKSLKAGTVLATGTDGYAPCSGERTPAAVLLEDVAAHESSAAQAAAVVHGQVVRSRLLDYSGDSETEASDALAAKLPATGIYLAQGGWSESNFN